MKSVWRTALVLCLIGVGRAGVAQDTPQETTWHAPTLTSTSIGASWGGPLGLGVTGEIIHGGLGVDVTDDQDRIKGVGGLLVQAHAATGGGKLSVGAGFSGRVTTDDFKGSAALALKASLARTWGSPRGTEPGLYYLGPELDLSAMRVAVSLGVLWRLGGGPGRSVLFSWGLGIRL
jgi:hypothetical protein